jgi:outer membrane protein TolC
MGDPQLDRIMADALAANPSLDEAAARLRMASGLIASAKAQRMPQVSADVSAMDQRLSNKYIYPAPLGGSWTWISNAQANLDWSLDLAGRQRELVRAAKSFTKANELQLAAARVSISGSVAQAYVNFARAEAQAASPANLSDRAPHRCGSLRPAVMPALAMNSTLPAPAPCNPRRNRR